MEILQERRRRRRKCDSQTINATANLFPPTRCWRRHRLLLLLLLLLKQCNVSFWLSVHIPYPLWQASHVSTKCFWQWKGFLNPSSLYLYIYVCINKSISRISTTVTGTGRMTTSIASKSTCIYRWAWGGESFKESAVEEEEDQRRLNGDFHWICVAKEEEREINRSGEEAG